MVIHLKEVAAYYLSKAPFQLSALPLLIGFCVFDLSLSPGGSVLKFWGQFSVRVIRPFGELNSVKLKS